MCSRQPNVGGISVPCLSYPSDSESWSWYEHELSSPLSHPFSLGQLPRSTYFLCPFPTSLHALHLTDSPFYSMSLGDICCLFDFLTLIVMTWYLSNPLKFMHIFKKYVLRIYYRLGTLLGIGCVEHSPYPLKTLRWILNAVREPPREQCERDRVGEAFSSPWGRTWEDFPEEMTLGLGSENFLSRSLWGKDKVKGNSSMFRPKKVVQQKSKEPGGKQWEMRWKWRSIKVICAEGSAFHPAGTGAIDELGPGIGVVINVPGLLTTSAGSGGVLSSPLSATRLTECLAHSS